VRPILRFLVLGVMFMVKRSYAPKYCRISVEGITGSGISSFLWDLESYGGYHIQWTNESECIWDGHWSNTDWFNYTAHKYGEWIYGMNTIPKGSTIFYERSVWSSMVYANWDYRVRRFLDLEGYKILKSEYEKMISNCPLPHLVVYFECPADKSPLPRNQFIALDDLYETWLSIMESKGVQVLRITPPNTYGLEHDFWMEKLIQQIEIYTRATYK